MTRKLAFITTISSVALIGSSWIGHSPTAQAWSRFSTSHRFARPAQTEMQKNLEFMRQVRLNHARELLGKHYEKSVVRNAENVTDVSNIVLQAARKKLKGRWKTQARRITRTILAESNRHQFDPLFLMAVIQHESSFNPAAVGSAGEIGLMQIRPTTGKWLAGKSKIRWRGEKTLRNPVTNIRLGAAYLAKLREDFKSRAQLYLAAYNMGSANVRSHVSKEVWPKVYPVRVMRYYLEMYEELLASTPGSAPTLKS